MKNIRIMPWLDKPEQTSKKSMTALGRLDLEMIPSQESQSVIDLSDFI
jgi:hypothetical protein